MKIFNYLLAALFALNLVQVKAQCAATGSHYTASYPTGWTITDLGDGTGTLSTSCGDNHNGTFYLAGTAAYFYTARGSRELRASSPIPVVNNTSWTMDFTLVINPSYYPPTLLATNSPSVVLAALTADQVSLQTSCSTPAGGDFCTTCGTYPNTNTDAMWVYLTSNPPSDCGESQAGKNWRIVAAARDGNGTQNNSTAISIPTTAGTYYIRLQRTNTGQAVVSVFANSNFTGHLAGSPQCLSIPGTVSDLDVLSHEVHSQGFCRRVFNGVVDHVKIDNGVTCPLPLSPSFTMSSSSVCVGQSFTVNGSASTSGTSIPISSHLWVVEECDVNGNQFGPVWFGPGINGAPSGNYTINPATVATAGVNMQCGHYYKVSLVVQNCGNGWAPASRVLYVNCPPAIKLKGSTGTICKGDQAGLTATITGGSGNYTMTWQQISPWGGTIYSGPPSSIIVTPTVTTTYQVTIYDNVTGCSSTAQWTVTVVDVDPTFSLFVNTANPGYFTVSLTPNDLTGYSLPGFQYGLTIEELDGSGNPLYWNSSMGGTTCWWNYPTAETFLGFVSTTTGPLFTQIVNPPCGSAGQFLYNHTYRITRLVLNDYCAPKQFSMIVTTVKSGEVVVMKDPNAPDMTHMLGHGQLQSATDDISIFPNPSTGIFTIGLEEGTENALIEVTNALGQKVKSVESAELRTDLDMTGFTKGIYLVTITSNGNSVMKKIVLE
jgi:hypothetical protein